MLKTVIFSLCWPLPTQKVKNTNFNILSFTLHRTRKILLFLLKWFDIFISITYPLPIPYNFEADCSKNYHSKVNVPCNLFFKNTQFCSRRSTGIYFFDHQNVVYIETFFLFKLQIGCISEKFK